MHEAAISNTPIPILWKTSDVEEKRARSMRRLYAGVGISLLCHALLFVFLPRRLETGNPPNELPATTKGPLVVRLAPPSAATEALPAEAPREATPVPRRRPPEAPTMMAIPRPQPQNPVAPLEPPVPRVPAPPDAPEAPSMMAMVEAARARRRAEEDALHQFTSEMRSRENPSGGDVATANLNRNLQSLSGRGGTSGVFQILQKGHRSGQFAFRGWTTGSRGDWKEVIDVDAGPQGDIELAMVRKMIELIRQHYQGNFNWESYRLGRVIVLSARQEDTAGLEAFLIREFFGLGR
ncbi:MAG: hypothetical protein ABI790_08845 [Betaproteobacteria bacterium]